MLECRELNIIRSNTPLYNNAVINGRRLVDKEGFVGLVNVNGRFCKLLSYPCKTGNRDHPNFKSSLSELCFVDTSDNVSTIDKLDTVVVHDVVNSEMNIPIESVRYLCKEQHGTEMAHIFIVNDTCILYAAVRSGYIHVDEWNGYFSYHPKDIESVRLWSEFYVIKTPDGRYDALQKVYGSIDEYYTKSEPHKKVIETANKFQYPKDFIE